MDSDPTRRSARGRTRRSVLRGIGLTAGVAGVSSVFGGVATARPEPDAAFETERVEIESFDGTTIVATLYVPASEGPHPAILMTHGWGSNRQANHPLAARYAGEEYVVLSYDSRGFGESGGTVTSTGPNEERDARELITWLGERDEVVTDDAGEPTIGMDGGSYGGAIQFRTAAADDRLDAIVPRITWHDLRHSYAPNGVLKWAWATALRQAGEAGGEIDPIVEDATEEMYERRELTPEAAAFYYERSPAEYLEEVTTPALIVHGWYDRLFTPTEALANVRGLRERGVETALVLENGGHYFGPLEESATETAFVADATLSWLDAHLKGDGDHGLPPVSYYDDSSDSFVTAGRFPPADATRERFELPINGAVRLHNWPNGKSKGETVTFDFPIDERTELVGTPTVRATVVPNGQGTTRLMFALQRVRGGEVTTVKDQITPVAVEEPTELELDLVPVQAVLEPGDTLRLAVAIEDEPLLNAPIPTSETGLFVDTDPRTGATLLSRPKRPAELEVPLRRPSS